jgi:hypothetical protein
MLEGLQSKSRCLVTLFSKGNVNIWHRRLGHASVETLRKLGMHGDLDDCHICPKGKLKYSKFSRGTFYAQQLLERVHSDVMDSVEEKQHHESEDVVLFTLQR